MIATERGRKTYGWVLGLAVAGSLAAEPALAQQQSARPSRIGIARTAPAKDDAAQPKKVRLDQIEAPSLKMTSVPANPSDAIAVVNGQVISRQRLADECVARKGKEILETLINRTLIEQALQARKQEVTAAEIDQEIDNVAHRFGIGREAWLRSLDKERGISPIQYARDVIYPALALRKLCTGRVQVTPQDLQDAFESQYGDKLRCRMIMVDKLATAQAVWEELKKNPAGFEKIAQEQSMDSGTRSLGGLLAEPITRHAYPKNVSDAAFRQLVDGDPADKDPTHKPKNGDITGIIQAGESVWVVLRREGVIPAVQGVSLKDERIRKQTYEMIYEVKLKETMGIVFQELARAAAIENKLTGSVKLANEEQEPDTPLDKNVRPAANQQEGGQPEQEAVRAAGATGSPKVKIPPPAAASPEAIKEFEKLRQNPIKPRTTTAPADAPAAGGQSR